jgi:hypothetical protein
MQDENFRKGNYTTKFLEGFKLKWDRLILFEGGFGSLFLLGRVRIGSFNRL